MQRSLPAPKRPSTPGASASTPSSPASRPNLLPGPGTAHTATPTPTPTPKPEQGHQHKLRPQSFDGKLVVLKKQMQHKGTDNVNPMGPFVDQEAAIEAQPLAGAEGEQSGPSGSKVGEGPSQDVMDLILVIHGIGQGVCGILSQPSLRFDDTNTSTADSAI
jgi:hypothetical protein